MSERDLAEADWPAAWRPSAVRRRFHHIGIVVDEPRQGEVFVPSLQAWLTDPDEHPQRVEFIRYPADADVPEEFRAIHVAYAVDDLTAAIAGRDLVTPPYDLAFFSGQPRAARCAVIREDGLLVECLQFEPGQAWVSAVRTARPPRWWMGARHGDG